MLVSDKEWTKFYQDFQKVGKLDLSQYKARQLNRRILSMVDSQECKNLDEFLLFVKKSPENTQWFLDRLAINVSELFRNPEKWKEMESTIIPELLKKSSSLKVWSAGCSYGAEAHSLACILDSKFPGRHRIVGTDIDKEALDQAIRGEFSQADTRAVPKEYLSYFEQKDSKFWATDPIKKYLQFKKQNLLADPFVGGYDLIMCRNVVIYFNEDAKDVLYRKFFRSLRPGGILFVGSTERITDADDIGFETALPFYYRKPQMDGKQWRNAS